MTFALLSRSRKKGTYVMVHEPGSQTGRVNRKKMFADANLRLTKNQRTGQTKLLEIIPLTVCCFQVKARNRTVFFSGKSLGREDRKQFYCIR
jgi:hypothetical protein